MIHAVVQGLLWLWLFGCIVTYKFGKWVLVEGMGLKSYEFLMLCLYSAAIASFWLWPSVGRWVLFGLLLFWFAIQFSSHWYYTIFGASKEKLRGYNDCFRATVKLFPASETRLIPDLYHTVLHLLILTEIVLLLTVY